MELASISPRRLLLLLAFAATFLLPIIPVRSLEITTADLSTLWTIGPSLPYNVTYHDGSTIFPLLLRGRLGISSSFGFFCSAPCSSFLLSIFLVSTNSISSITNIINATPQVVWSANRDRPVHQNATLLFSQDGDLILRDADGFLVWSTNTSGQGATALSLQEPGNLVVMDNKRNLLWASFDHPTDSLLVEQSLKLGQKLTANSSPSHPASGQISLTVDDYGLRAYINSNPPQLYHSITVPGPSKAKNRSAYMIFHNGSLDLFVLFTQPNLPDFSMSLLPNSNAQYLRLEADGKLNLHAWDGLSWNLLHNALAAPYGNCGHPTVCGQYGICSNGNCSCPQGPHGGSSYFIPVNPNQISLGCDLLTPISCQSIKSHQLLALGNISYFNYVDNSTSAMRITDIESCKQACLANCSCKAALFKYEINASHGSCYLPSQLFSLMKNDPKNSNYNSSAFVKVQLVIPHNESGKVINYGSFSAGRKLNLRNKIVVGVVSGFLLAAILVAFISKICLGRRRVGQGEEEDQFDEIPGIPGRFSYEDIKDATNNFEKSIGQGGFGTVFMGTLSNGMFIAVKRLDCIGQGKKQFLAEAEIIGGIHHINLVKLIGFCVEKSHRLLVFEYVANGSLDKWIFVSKQESVLNWQTKRSIIFDIAKGLSYLHEECSQRIAHLDIKPQNILLDEKFYAKVGDFGLSKLIDRDHTETVTRMRGTPGYLAPEWLTSIITEKVDVYSFGVVVVEIICGRKNLDPSKPEESLHLIALVQEKLKDDMLLDLLHENSSDMKLHSEEVVEMMRLAIWCLQSDCSRRPPMSTVVKVLEGSSRVNDDLDHELLGGNMFICMSDTREVPMSRIHVMAGEGVVDEMPTPMHVKTLAVMGEGHEGLVLHDAHES